jgi:D-glycero-alpha-D-manno-heptose-7-phosphate kinase
VGGAINKYSYITARFLPPFHEYRSRFVYSMTECCHHNSSVSHKAIRATLKHLGLAEPDSPGLEVLHASDLPGRSGTGSSSTFVVGLLNTLSALQGKLMLPYELTEAAIHIEQQLLGETVGCQDQTFAAHGGLNVIRFRVDGEICVEPLVLDANHVRELEAHLMLFFTKMPRTSSEVAQSYAPTLGQKAKEQFAMLRLAEQGIDAIYRRNWERLGHLIDQSWRIKAGLSDAVTNDTINRTYAAARLAGALGGKLTGAGGGGCMVLVVPPEKRQAVIQALPQAVHIPFGFDFGGSTVIFSDKDNIRDYRQSA